MLGNQVRLLQDGEATHAAMFDAIRARVTMSTLSLGTSSKTTRWVRSLQISCSPSRRGVCR